MFGEKNEVETHIWRKKMRSKLIYGGKKEVDTHIRCEGSKQKIDNYVEVLFSFHNLGGYYKPLLFAIIVIEL